MIQLKAFHGTSWENGQSILCEKSFHTGDSEKLRMGVGAYFFVRLGAKKITPFDVRRNWKNIIGNRENAMKNMRFYPAKLNAMKKNILICMTHRCWNTSIRCGI